MHTHAVGMTRMTQTQSPAGSKSSILSRVKTILISEMNREKDAATRGGQGGGAPYLSVSFAYSKRPRIRLVRDEFGSLSRVVTGSWAGTPLVFPPDALPALLYISPHLSYDYVRVFLW